MRTQPMTRGRAAPATRMSARASEPTRRGRASDDDEDESPRRSAVATRGRTAVKSVKKATRKRNSDPVTSDLRPIKNKFTKVELYDHIAEATGLDRKTVKTVLVDGLEKVILASLMPGSIKAFTMSGLFKIMAKKKPQRIQNAIKAGTLVANPFNGGKMEPHKGRPKKVIPATMKAKILPQSKIKLAVLGQ